MENVVTTIPNPTRNKSMRVDTPMFAERVFVSSKDSNILLIGFIQVVSINVLSIAYASDDRFSSSRVYHNQAGTRKDLAKMFPGVITSNVLNTLDTLSKTGKKAEVFFDEPIRVDSFHVPNVGPIPCGLQVTESLTHRTRTGEWTQTAKRAGEGGDYLCLMSRIPVMDGDEEVGSRTKYFAIFREVRLVDKDTLESEGHRTFPREDVARVSDASQVAIFNTVEPRGSSVVKEQAPVEEEVA